MAWGDGRAGSAWSSLRHPWGSLRGDPRQSGAYSPLGVVANFPGLFSGGTTPPDFISALGTARRSRGISPPCDRGGPAGRRSLCRPFWLRPGTANKPRRVPSVTGLSASPVPSGTRDGADLFLSMEDGYGRSRLSALSFLANLATRQTPPIKDRHHADGWNLSRTWKRVNGVDGCAEKKFLTVGLGAARITMLQG